MIDANVELPPATLAAAPVCRDGPRALAHDRQAGALDDEMDGVPWPGRDGASQQAADSARERVVWSGASRSAPIKAQDRPHEPLRLAQG